MLTDLKLFLSHSGLDATLSISVQTSIEGHFSALRHHITVFNTSTPHDRFQTLESLAITSGASAGERQSAPRCSGLSAN